MCKRNFVKLIKRKNTYKLCFEDIKVVHSWDIKKRPTLPRYEPETDDTVTMPETKSKHNIIKI